MMYVRPRKPDMVIRDPRSRLKLPPYGGKVPNISYWVRRLNCEDVVPTTLDAINKGKAEAEANAKLKAEDKAAKAKDKPKQKTSAGKGSK